MTTTVFVTFCLVFAIMISIRVHSISVGETYCIEGYVMDYYCIKDGFLLDNPSVVTLEGPDQHSIHCLVDVDVCVTSPYEILTDPSEDGGLYGRGWRVTDTSQQILVDLARTVGDQCYTCFNLGMQTRGFRAVMNATVVALASGDIPPIVEVHTAFPTSVISEDVVTDGTQRKVRLSETDDPCLEYYSMPTEAPSKSIDGSDIPTLDETDSNISNGGSDIPTLDETDSNISNGGSDIPTLDETNSNISNGGSEIPTLDETDSNISTGGSDIPTLDENETNISNGGSDIPTLNETDSSISNDGSDIPTLNETDSNISNSTVDETDSSATRLQRIYGIRGWLVVLAWVSLLLAYR